MSRDDYSDTGNMSYNQNYPEGDHMDYDRQYGQGTGHAIHDSVQNFIFLLYKAIEAGNVDDIQTLYETNYVKLSERFFANSPWPDIADIEDLVPDKEIFNILYRELYYRHIYAKLSNNLDIVHRLDSYYNYCELFNYIVRSEVPISLVLPNQWLWEIIDEFLYQFQSFSHYTLQMKSPDDIKALQDHPKVWNVHSVLNVLHSLVDKSNINLQLQAYSNGEDPDAVAGEFGRYPLYKMLGYFSLIGLLRLHSLLGDYYQAIKVLEHIELNKKSYYSRVPACQITTYYYVGFAYMMMRRYADAIRIFSTILLYIQRTRQLYQYKTYLVDQINKQVDKMYTLLAICLTLQPQSIDESVMSQLKDKFHDKLNRLQTCEFDEFEKSFSYACPKFISPIPPKSLMHDGTTKETPTKDPFSYQLKVFKDEVTHQYKLPLIRSYLTHYTTMPIPKLAKFLNMTESALVNELLCFKHKMKNMVWTKGTSGLDGEFQSGSDMDFYIENDMIHIADTKVARRYGDYFIRQIHKYLDLSRSISKLPV